MSKSWQDTIEVSGNIFTYGFIDEGGKKWGDRYFVVVNDTAVPVEIAEKMVKLCEAHKRISTAKPYENAPKVIN